MRTIQSIIAFAMAECSVSALAIPVSGGSLLVSAQVPHSQFIDDITEDLVPEAGKRAEIDYIYTQKENKREELDYIYTQ